MSEDVRLDNTVIRWPKYIPQPENYFLLLAEAALDEVNGWSAGFPKVDRFEIDLYVRSHNVNVGERIVRRFDGVVANWHLNCVPMPRDCEPCGHAVFVKGE